MAKICIDAGHYGKYNRSPVEPKYYESDMTWKLHLMLKEELKERGFSVVTTRSKKDNDLELTARGRKAAGCDLFLSLHSNAVGTESVDRPVGIYLLSDASTSADEKSKVIAQKLAKVVRETMKTSQDEQVFSKKGDDRNGDGKADNYYGVLHGARSVNVPGVILEHGFHTNKKCAQWLLKEENLRKLAVAEADALAEYFGVKKTTPSSSSSKPATSTKSADIFYRVRTQKHGWLTEIKNLTDYAGWEDSPITDVAIRVSSGSVKYRVHVKGGGWLNYITKCDLNDKMTGYAGNGKPIDAIEVYYYTPKGEMVKKAKYRVAPTGKGYWSWQYDNETKNGQDGYAGAFGITIGKLQITLE